MQRKRERKRTDVDEARGLVADEELLVGRRADALVLRAGWVLESVSARQEDQGAKGDDGRSSSARCRRRGRRCVVRGRVGACRRDRASPGLRAERAVPRGCLLVEVAAARRGVRGARRRGEGRGRERLERGRVVPASQLRPCRGCWVPSLERLGRVGERGRARRGREEDGRRAASSALAPIAFECASLACTSSCELYLTRTTRQSPSTSRRRRPLGPHLLAVLPSSASVRSTSPRKLQSSASPAQVRPLSLGHATCPR